MTPEHRTAERFDFLEPHDAQAFACRQVADGAPVLFVAHDEECAWQFLCGGDHPDGGLDGALMTCLGCAAARDPAINDVAGLARGQQAARTGVGQAWADVAKDSRWSRILGQHWSCTACGQQHHGLFDLACSRPDHWQGSEIQRPNAEALTSRHFLSEDFCILDGEHFFVRSVLPIPLLGSGGGTFAFGVWSTLSESNFERYRETFDSGDQGALGPWFGWFSNRLRGYPDTLNLKCQVHPRAWRRRPWIEITLQDHPLAVEQRTGITLERLAEVLGLYGHSIDEALLRWP